MRTRCSGCQTTFRVTPEQLRARAGKVRCGQCMTIFNALDSLVEDEAGKPVTTPASRVTAAVLPARQASHAAPANDADAMHPPGGRAEPRLDLDALAFDADESVVAPIVADAQMQQAVEPVTGSANEPSAEDATEAAAQKFRVDGLIMPREINEIPGYNKWAEGVMIPPAEVPAERQSGVFFLLVALLFAGTLAVQAGYRFRGEIAVAVPVLRPVLERIGETAGFDIPLPQRADLLSIESSDLQSDAARGGLLVLQATLRNRAPYAQAYPHIELSLTDTLDSAVLRRVLSPEDYLAAPGTAEQPFSSNTDVAIRLWIEAKDVAAAGYRLYVFYP